MKGENDGVEMKRKDKERRMKGKGWIGKEGGGGR